MHALRKHEFNPDQPRDADGKWGDGGGGAGDKRGGSVAVTNEAKVQSNARGIFGKDLKADDIKDLAGVHAVDIAGAHTTEYHVRPHGTDGLHIEAHVKNEKGETLLHVKRQIETNWETGKREVEAHHDLMVVHKDLQGQGIGDKLFAAQLANYQKLGNIDRITTDAAWTGQYMWPRTGFALKEAGHLAEFKEGLSKFAAEKGIKADLSKVKSIHDLSKVTVKAPFEHNGNQWTQLGKAFLTSRTGPEIGLKFELGKGSKELKDYVKSRKK
jgi:GNAT superfamily N-acetyltransferase